MVKKLDTAPYKGVRDFYPEDMWLLKHLFATIRKEVERFGYVEYGASILEPAELYRAKSGEEIVSDQTYTFLDRGEREVTLRPEMTPTVARMVADQKRNLSFPLRWYSLPNLFRYENPQRGRLREHYQLNVDLFGVTDLSGDVEVIELAANILKAFGASEEDFVIQVNSRKLMEALFARFELNSNQIHTVSKILDKKAKISEEIFDASIKEVLGEKASEFISLFHSKEKLLDFVGAEEESVKNFINLIESLSSLNVNNVVFTPTLMRGFDYYTDIVFEIFDTSPENNRSLFGGGRYDNLLELFGNDNLPAVGFGMGDVTLIHFLEVHNLLPTYVPETQAILAPVGTISPLTLAERARDIRKEGIRLAVNQNAKKPADIIKGALKAKIPFIIFLGEDEIAKNTYTVKNLKTEETKTVNKEEVAQIINTK
jgi:histidyl-tRNA synthetase